MPLRLDELPGWVDAVISSQAATETRLKALEAAVQSIRGADQLQDSLLTTLTARVAALEAAPVPPVITYGPRRAVGPDVPVDATEQAWIASGVQPATKDAAGIQAALTKAAGAKPVYLPPGSYKIDRPILTPMGSTLFGAGAGTVLLAGAAGTEMFFVTGPNVRFSRLVLQGQAQTWSASGGRAIQNVGPNLKGGGYENLCVDHCRLSGFAYAVYSSAGSVRVEACEISNSLVASQGYAVNVGMGALALVTDCLFANNRHSVASGGGGARKTHWEAVHCRVQGDELVPNGLEQGTFDAHGDMDGELAVEGCELLNLAQGSAFGGGQGLITGCRMADCEIGWVVRAVSSGGVPGAPHDYVFDGNVMERVTTPYKWAGAKNCYVDGKPIPETLDGAWRPPPRIPRLTVDSSGALKLL